MVFSYSPFNLFLNASYPMDHLQKDCSYRIAAPATLRKKPESLNAGFHLAYLNLANRHVLRIDLCIAYTYLVNRKFVWLGSFLFRLKIK